MNTLEKPSANPAATSSPGQYMIFGLLHGGLCKLSPVTDATNPLLFKPNHFSLYFFIRFTVLFKHFFIIMYFNAIVSFRTKHLLSSSTRFLMANMVQILSFLINQKIIRMLFALLVCGKELDGGS